MNSTSNGREAQNHFFQDSLQEAALDLEWEEKYSQKYTQLPESRSPFSPNRWSTEERASMSGKAGTV